jgi:hypothetical protein
LSLVVSVSLVSPVNGIYHSEKIGFSIELPIDWNSTVLDYPSGFYGDEGGIITILSKPITVENNNNLNKKQIHDDDTSDG